MKANLKSIIKKNDTRYKNKLVLFILVSVIVFSACSEPDQNSVIATFSWQQAAGTDTVHFINQSEGANTYLWNFGDATTSREENPSHAYSRTGLFNVTLTATGEEDSDQVSQSVLVEKVRPLAFFLWHLILGTDSIQFTNYSKYGDRYHWDFGDGGTSDEIHPLHVYDTTGCFSVQLIVKNDFASDTSTATITIDMDIVYKPNIYFYPETAMDLSVTLNFPQGGSVITSIPDYGSGWKIHLDEKGKIDGWYDYLFYESVQPDVWQTETGWCIPKNELKHFFIDNMSLWNFNDEEIEDFTEYWIQRLTEYDYYLINPQTTDRINTVIELNLSVEPDQLNRLFYLIRGSNEPVWMESPNVVTFPRNGFTVMEWGVILK